MGGQTIRTSVTKLDAMQLQSSARGVTIPWVRGVTRVACNLSWYGGFKATAHTETQGGKGGASTENTSYSYSASAVMGVCRGPVIDFPRVWIGKTLTTSAFTGAQVATAVETYAVPASGAMAFTPAHASPMLCILSVTVVGRYGAGRTSMLVEGQHFRVSGGVIIVLDDLLRGKTLTVTYQWAASAIMHGALQTLGLSFLGGRIGQSVWSGLSAFPAEAIGYSGLAAVAGQDYSLGTTAQLENHLFEVVGPMAYHLGPTQPDVDPALFVSELLLDQRDGAGFPAEFMGDLTAWSDYCVAAGILVSPALTEQTTAAEVVKQAAELTGSMISTMDGRLQIVPRADAAEAGNGRTYTPNLTPLYDLTDECYTPTSTGGSPVKFRLKSGTERYNTWSLEFRNRALNYATEPADAKDAADIAERGAKANPNAVKAEWIADAAVARKVVQLLMQRSISVRAEYEVPLPPHYSLISLGAMLTLTDTRLEMDRVPVLVTKITENDAGDLNVLCEDYPIGAASAPRYAPPDGIGYQPNYDVDPGDVDPPLVFEGPAARAGSTGVEVYIAVRGSDPNWGGCDIWTSLDGTNYKLLTTVQGGSRYGEVEADVLATDTAVSVHGLGNTQLLSGSAADAAGLVTLCYMTDLDGSDGEFFAYQTATLTGAGAYTLGGLVRGAYDTKPSVHTAGGDFVRVDDRLGRSGELDATMVGKTMHIKCTSFNIYGAGQQSLADVSETTYVITGSQYGTIGRAFRVVSDGYADTNAPVPNGLYDMATGQRLYSGTRSYDMVRIRRSAPYDVTFHRQYDVYGAGAIGGYGAVTLATDLNATGNDMLVVVWTTDEPALHRLDGPLPAAMYRCGASRGVFGSPMFRSNSAYVLVGVAGCGEGNGAEAYNGDVNGDTNAWADMFFSVGPRGLSISGMTAKPRSLRDYSYTGDLNASAGTVLIPVGYCSASGSTISGNSTSAWGAASCYSRDGYTGGAYASAVPMQTNQPIMFGLNPDPTTDLGFAGINYALYTLADGGLRVYESGVSMLTVAGGYAVGDVLAIVYDGASVKYLKNGTVVRTVAAAAGQKLFFDSAFYAAGSLSNMQFGPLSPVTGIGTNQLVDEAATRVRTTRVTGPVSVTEEGHVPRGYNWANPIITETFTPDASRPGDIDVIVTVMCTATITGVDTGSGEFGGGVTLTIQDGGTWDAWTGTEQDLSVNVGQTLSQRFHITRVCRVAAAVSNTFGLYAFKIGGTAASVTFAEMRTEVIKK